MTNITSKVLFDNLYADIKDVLTSARITAVVAVNTTMVKAYWAIGKLIVEAQGGEHKAAYGHNLLNEISTRLSAEYGKGFDPSNLRRMRQFYLAFPICDTVCHKLSWSHIRHLIKVSDANARSYYAEESIKGRWSVRELERQIATQHYERLLSTHRDKADTQELLLANLPAKPERFDPLALVHDPYILEFLDVKPDSALQESELENAIISHLEQFMLELGRGFAFVGRQKRITIDGQHFYPDLVFYNIQARCYVIIDLKMHGPDYSDIGQMQLYVNYYNMDVCTEHDNPTVGIILCSEKNDAVVRYTLGNRNDIGVFSPQYKLIMPTEEELKREMEITRENFKLLNQ
ncbi:MAG: PDDEXK nuclease domain-containing protein [Muribaculaceae bacterium]|nr:PDDEXK nuclease domain-containing protein [Muribaculaceae bacterium]